MPIQKYEVFLDGCDRGQEAYRAGHIVIGHHADKSVKKIKGPGTMEKLARADTISMLCKKRLPTLTSDDRECYIADWYYEEEYAALSKELQLFLSEKEDCRDDIENSQYDELILLNMKEDYRGVTNDFLSNSLRDEGLGLFDVHGMVDKMEVCPCCKYRTLQERGEYDVCRLCRWEDDGDFEDENEHSGPNHMTLAEGKKQFRENMHRLPLQKWLKHG